jgi:hypothetical protein
LICEDTIGFIREPGTAGASGILKQWQPGGPFGFGNHVLISSHRKLPQSKAVVVRVAGADPSPGIS